MDPYTVYIIYFKVLNYIFFFIKIIFIEYSIILENNNVILFIFVSFSQLLSVVGSHNQIISTSI